MDLAEEVCRNRYREGQQGDDARLRQPDVEEGDSQKPDVASGEGLINGRRRDQAEGQNSGENQEGAGG